MNALRTRTHTPEQKEIKQIVKKRTALETALVRRSPRKADYLAYIAYEAGLEALRKKRAARLRAYTVLFILLLTSPSTHLLFYPYACIRDILSRSLRGLMLSYF
jgi:DNA-binding GntR family transcriptional regulator